MSKTLTDTMGDLGLSQDILHSLPVFQNAVSHPMGKPALEEVVLCYTVGTLTFNEFTGGKHSPLRYGRLDMDLFNLDGSWNGHYLSIWQPLAAPGEDLSKAPVPQHHGPWDKLTDPVPQPHFRANGYHRYEFRGQGGTGAGFIYATGPGNLLLTKLAGGGGIFQVSVATYITGGTGDFEGVHGANTALGSSFVPPGADLSSLPLGVPVPGVTVSTFRLVRKTNQG